VTAKEIYQTMAIGHGNDKSINIPGFAELIFNRELVNAQNGLSVFFLPW